MGFARESRAAGLRTGAVELLFVGAAAFAVFANAIPGGFVVDDRHQIVDNPWIREPGRLPEVFTSGVWEFEGRFSSYYRPMMYVAYLAVHSLFGESAWAFHVASILLHAGCSCLVLLLARASLARLDGPEAARGAVPVVAALLFATHPIHTEAVAWAAGMADLGFAFFGLLALLLYALGRDGRWGESLPASVALLVSALFKEPGVAVLGVMAVYEIAARAPGESWRSSLLRLAPPGLAVASYAALRFAALGGLAPTVAEPWDPPRQMAAALALLGLDLRFLMLPVGLNFWHVFRPPASPVAAEVLIAAAWVAAAAAAAVRAIRRSRAMAVATALLLLPLLPALHAGALNQGIGNAFTERYLYLPSAGFLMLLAWWGARIARRLSPPSWPGILAAALLVAAYATATVARNPVWRDHLTLWSDALAKSPDSAIAHLNYGYALMYAKRSAEGREHLRRAVALDPGLVDVEIAKGRAYADRGLVKKAILAFHAALVLDPRSAEAHEHLGRLYESRGQDAAAMKEYRSALALGSENPELRWRLARLAAKAGG